MIGQVHFFSDRVMIEINDYGTLQCLGSLSMFRQLHLWLLTRFMGNWGMADTHMFVRIWNLQEMGNARRVDAWRAYMKRRRA